MKQLTIFRVLTYILLPFAALLGLMDAIILLNAIANPAFLLIGFILATFVIYTVVSMQFLIKGIDNRRRCNPSLRDWIRVNAYVCFFMAGLFVLNALSIFFTSDISLRQYLSKFMEVQPKMPPMVNLEFLLSMMKGMAWFMFFFGLVLLVHIRINFKLLKTHAQLFTANESE